MTNPTFCVSRDAAWSLAPLLALGIHHAVWYGLALGAVLGRLFNRFRLRLW